MKAITMRIEPLEVGGQKVYTIRQFASIIQKSDQTVHSLISKGNRERKLKAIKIGGKPFILASELTQFPFTCSGKGNDVYYYNSEGVIDYERSKLS